MVFEKRQDPTKMYDVFVKYKNFEIPNNYPYNLDRMKQQKRSHVAVIFTFYFFNSTIFFLCNFENIQFHLSYLLPSHFVFILKTTFVSILRHVLPYSIVFKYPKHFTFLLQYLISQLSQCLFSVVFSPKLLDFQICSSSPNPFSTFSSSYCLANRLPRFFSLASRVGGSARQFLGSLQWGRGDGFDIQNLQLLLENNQTTVSLGATRVPGGGQ